MNKDVIYIDVEDDITAIIGKVKDSKQKIVALVPPKRIGVLQSAVNLHLLVRMAKNADKQLVLVTNNQALIALSAAAAIPVAKNLQSKPEIAVIPALSIDDGEDIIDGAQLPVGELAATADTPAEIIAPKRRPDVDNLVDTIDVDGEAAVAPIVGAAAAAPKKPLPPRSNIKVPNFSRFRKKLFIGIIVLILLIGFLIWANVFAPAATIVITAKTIPSPISKTVTLTTSDTDTSKSLIQTVPQTLQKTVSVKFTPTGTQDIGNKASGTITITRNGVSDSSTPVPAGTEFSSGSLSFLTTTAATVPATSISGNKLNNGSVTVDVQAENPGPSYNLSAQSYQSGISGFSAQGSAMTGGTTNVQTVVSASDIATATTALNALSSDSDKKTLLAQYKNGEHVIANSYTVTRATPISSPALNAQASGTNSATLSSAVTYSVNAIASPDIKEFLDAALNAQIKGTSSQRIYDDGESKVVLAGYTTNGGVSTINLATTGQVGPKIDILKVKSQAMGKKSGEVQAQLETIDGVTNAVVKFSYPWVTTVPKNDDKIDINFNLTNG